MGKKLPDFILICKPEHKLWVFFIFVTNCSRWIIRNAIKQIMISMIMYLLAEMEIGFSEMEKHSRHYTALCIFPDL